MKPQSYYINLKDYNILRYAIYVCVGMYSHTHTHTICKDQSSVRKSYTQIRQNPF